jgi:hypothetical protein
VISAEVFLRNYRCKKKTLAPYIKAKIYMALAQNLQFALFASEGAFQAVFDHNSPC